MCVVNGCYSALLEPAQIHGEVREHLSDIVRFKYDTPYFDCSDSGEEAVEKKKWAKGSPQSNSYSDSEPRSGDSLPRQSVMRRPVPSTKPPSDYNPSTSSESESESVSQSESESSSDEERENERDRETGVQFSAKLLPPSQRRARFGSDSDYKEEEEEEEENGHIPLSLPRQTSAHGHSAAKTHFRSFYMDEEEEEEVMETQYGVPRRQAARNVKYVMDSYSEEESDGFMKMRGRRRRKRNSSDSEFQLSGGEVEGEEFDTFGSESFTDESSSDEYTPYSHPKKRGGRKGGKKRRRKVRTSTCNVMHWTKKGTVLQYG